MFWVGVGVVVVGCVIGRAVNIMEDVSEYGGSNVWTYMIAADGSLNSGERYMDLRTPTNRADSGGDGSEADREHRGNADARDDHTQRKGELDLPQ